MANKITSYLHTTLEFVSDLSNAVKKGKCGKDLVKNVDTPKYYLQAQEKCFHENTPVKCKPCQVQVVSFVLYDSNRVNFCRQFSCADSL